jgi:uroporphyrinogen decarboxylase
MTKREITKSALAGEAVPYTPWSFRFTAEAREKLRVHYGTDDIARAAGNHIVELGSDVGFYEDIGDNRSKDVFGVVWDKRVDKDIGNVEGAVLTEPTLDGYMFPDPLDARFFADIPEKLNHSGDCFRLFCLGFSLFERAWTLRGMTTLLMDFYDHPEFVRSLLRAIADYNIAQALKALEHDIDGVYFGDDWGQQRGLIMGHALWKEYIYPELKRMYTVVKDHGKSVFIHSCGDVDELFDELAAIGVTCFNPFQPEVMDCEALYRDYRGRLSFWGGLSTQQTLAFGTPDDVRDASRQLITMGQAGSYIFSPAHAVGKDVSLENMLAFIEVAENQPAYGDHYTLR